MHSEENSKGKSLKRKICAKKFATIIKQDIVQRFKMVQHSLTEFSTNNLKSVSWFSMTQTIQSEIGTFWWILYLMFDLDIYCGHY